MACNHDERFKNALPISNSCLACYSEHQAEICGWYWRLRSDLLAALLECHDYDSLYKRGMELVDEYKPDS